MPLGSPLDWFQIGYQSGPGAGIGQMLRGVLDTHNKMMESAAPKVAEAAMPESQAKAEYYKSMVPIKLNARDEIRWSQAIKDAEKYMHETNLWTNDISIDSPKRTQIAMQLYEGSKMPGPGASADTGDTSGAGGTGWSMDSFLKGAGNIAGNAISGIGSVLPGIGSSIGSALYRFSGAYSRPQSAPSGVGGVPNFDPATQRLLMNTRTKEYKVVPK